MYICQTLANGDKNFLSHECMNLKCYKKIMLLSYKFKSCELSHVKCFKYNYAASFDGLDAAKNKILGNSIADFDGLVVEMLKKKKTILL